jgi:hypothetical protein
MTFDADLGFSDRSLAARHGNLDGAVAPVSAGKGHGEVWLADTRRLGPGGVAAWHPGERPGQDAHGCHAIGRESVGPHSIVAARGVTDLTRRTSAATSQAWCPYSQSDSSACCLTCLLYRSPRAKSGFVNFPLPAGGQQRFTMPRKVTHLRHPA